MYSGVFIVFLFLVFCWRCAGYCDGMFVFVNSGYFSFVFSSLKGSRVMWLFFFASGFRFRVLKSFLILLVR